jgi:predicted regulator of Ras-like GTPase activity (Roadblock/LC7/MglB family)
MDQKVIVEAVGELLGSSEVKGAAIFNQTGEVVSWQTQEDIKPRQYIDFIKAHILKNPGDFISEYKNGLFSQKIMDFNGSRILVSGIRPDLIFLLFVKQNAYLGLTMLEMEGCIRKLDNALNMCNT